jgi:gluconokinase
VGADTVVLLLMGVSGSGKTTIGEALAKRLSFSFVDADDFHSDENRKKMHSGHALTDQDRLPWLELLAANISEWLASGQNTILACSALKSSYRQMLIGDQDHVIILFLDGSFELFAERLAKRNHPFMNSTLLRSQFDTLEKPSDAIFLDASLSPDQIVDQAEKSLQERMVQLKASRS